MNFIDVKKPSMMLNAENLNQGKMCHQKYVWIVNFDIHQKILIL